MKHVFVFNPKSFFEKKQMAYIQESQGFPSSYRTFPVMPAEYTFSLFS
jgi:hypothetical protein